MDNCPRAFFVLNPSRIEDLKRPHLPVPSRPYRIVHMVELTKTDYQNLTTDLKADRWFIEKYMHDCFIEHSVWRCILARQKSRTDGVLIMSDDTDYPKWVAYLPGDTDDK